VAARTSLLEAGRRDHFADAGYYAHAYRDRTEDVAFYEALVAELGGPVLEYGVGDGRVALPLARAGHELTGVDLSRPMLDAFRATLAAEPAAVRRRVKLVEGDMSQVALRRRFPLVICPFNALLHLYDRASLEAFFARVHAHLAPGGRFVFDISVPAPEDLARDPSRAYRVPPFRHPTAGCVVKYEEYFAYDHVSQVLHVDFVFTERDDPSHRWKTHLAQRMYFPQEIEALLHYNGFRVLAVEGDFEGGPLTGASDTMVWYVEAAAPRRRKRGGHGERP
jgi:SAM-dependent methyltransferase